MAMKGPPIMRGAPPARDQQVTLDNWRTAPFNRWAFCHVREIIPSAAIATGRPLPLRTDPRDVTRIAFTDGHGRERTIGEVLSAGNTSGLVVLRGGRVAAEWFANGYDGQRPHILFSVSKSITSVLTGIVADRGLLDPDDPVGKYIPEVEGSAYADASVRHVLDMTVSSSFEEAYLDSDSDYARYRAATGWNPPGDHSPGDLRSFLLTLKPGEEAHGERFHYLSPNSDLLGWIVERASGRRIADLLSEYLWQPLGAKTPGEITLDRLGAGRTAGGICATPHDLARLGEMMRRRGVAGGRQIVPGWWVDDITNGGGDNSAWLKGDLVHLFPTGGYRSKWYRTGLASGAFCAIGIHGQWLYIDPAREVVIAKVSAQPEPTDEPLEELLVQAFDALAADLAPRVI